MCYSCGNFVVFFFFFLFFFLSKRTIENKNHIHWTIHMKLNWHKCNDDGFFPMVKYLFSLLFWQKIILYLHIVVNAKQATAPVASIFVALHHNVTGAEPSHENPRYRIKSDTIQIEMLFFTLIWLLNGFCFGSISEDYHFLMIPDGRIGVVFSFIH